MRARRVRKRRMRAFWGISGWIAYVEREGGSNGLLFLLPES